MKSQGGGGFAAREKEIVALGPKTLSGPGARWCFLQGGGHYLKIRHR